MSTLIIVILSVLIVDTILLAFLLLKKVAVDLTPVQASCDKIERGVREEVARNREEQQRAERESREELSLAVRRSEESLQRELQTMSSSLDTRLSAIRSVLDERMQSVQEAMQGKLDEMRNAGEQSGRALREELTLNLQGTNTSIVSNISEMAKRQESLLAVFSEQLNKLTHSNEQKLEAVRGVVNERLEALQQDNTKQLEEMRKTVDEKLQGTLEKRLGESFKQVSERLEAVSRGLGEMQALATGVGDLKRVLTNVKTRGTFGEVQLGAMLSEVLTPEQYETNVATKNGTERVEFAIKLPGHGGESDEIVWLPIDAKFPTEDYQRLLDAQDRGDAEAQELAAKELETRIRKCASDIFSKYVSPPATTDFGILFLPTEGLFAEVIRRPGLSESIQRDCHVVLAGPTTLWSILNSLQMGFRTLAIQQRSGEVWNLLSAVKTEWGKYGEVLEKVNKKLHEASDTLEKVQVRSRAIGRKLKDVEALPTQDAQSVLMMTDDNLPDETENG